MAGFATSCSSRPPPTCSREQGFHAVGIDDIGAAAGVSGPAAYRHFQNKDAILREPCDAALTELLARARRATTADTPSEVLRTLVELHAVFGARRRGRLRRRAPLIVTACAPCPAAPTAQLRGHLGRRAGTGTRRSGRRTRTGPRRRLLLLLNASAHLHASPDDAILAAAAAAAPFSASGDRFGSAAG